MYVCYLLHVIFNIFTVQHKQLFLMCFVVCDEIDTKVPVDFIEFPSTSSLKSSAT